MYYSKLIKNGKVITVEAKSVKALSPGFVMMTKTKYDVFLTSLPPKPPPKPVRDLAAELTALDERVKILEEK